MSGRVAYSERPYAAVVAVEQWAGKVCFGCFKFAVANDLRRCAGCSQVWYCSRACQRRDWRLGQHRFECRPFFAAASAEERRSFHLLLNGCGKNIRLVARIVARLQLDAGRPVDADCADGFEPSDQRSLFDLMYREEFGKGAEEIDKAWQLFREIYASQENLFEKVTRERFEEIYGRVCVNSHSIVQYELLKSHTLGQAVYLNASMWDHSCDPDMEFYYEGDRFTVRFLPGKEAVAKRKNVRQLTIPYCYLDVWSTRRRREYLKESYHFDCYCSLCGDVEEDRRRRYCLEETCDECGDFLLFEWPKHSGKTNCAFCFRCAAFRPYDENKFELLLNFWQSYDSYEGDLIKFCAENHFLRHDESLPLDQVRNTTLASIRVELLEYVQQKLRLASDTEKGTTMSEGEEQLALLTAVVLSDRLHKTFEFYRIFSPNHSRLVMTVAQHFWKEDKKEKCRDYMFKARDIWRNMYSDNYPCVAEIEKLLLKRFPAESADAAV